MMLRSIFMLLALLSGLSSSAFASEEEKEGGRQRHYQGEQGPVYIPFAPFTVSVRGESRVEGLMTITFTLEVMGEDTADKVRALQPRISNAVNMYVTRYAAIGVHAKKKVDVEILDTIIQRAVDSVMGDIKTDVMVVDAMTRVL